MGLIVQSQEDKLRLTGMSVRFKEVNGGLELVVVRSFYATPADRIVDVCGSEMQITLCDRWTEIVQKNFMPELQVVIDLKKCPSAPDDEEDIGFLTDRRHSHYEVENIQFRPHPMNTHHL